jgi:hypothetical protein
MVVAYCKMLSWFSLVNCTEKSPLFHRNSETEFVCPILGRTATHSVVSLISKLCPKIVHLLSLNVLLSVLLLVRD